MNKHMGKTCNLFAKRQGDPYLGYSQEKLTDLMKKKMVKVNLRGKV
jgi:hypothetical protein